MVWLHPAGRTRQAGVVTIGVRVVGTAVIETEFFAASDRVADGKQHVGYGCRWVVSREGREFDRVDSWPQSARQYLPHGGQCPSRRFPDVCAGVGCGLQRDRNRDDLFVVEQHRGDNRAGVEPIAAVASLGGADLVAEFTQPVHIATQGALADIEAVGQEPPRPVAWCLE